MPRWNSIHIERLRRLEGLRLDSLGTVNLLVGKNNSGKTSVLEALAIASNPTDAFTWIDSGRERESKSARTQVLEVLNWLFPHTTPRENGFEGTAAIEGQVVSGEKLRIDAGYREYRELEISPVIDATTELGGDEEVAEYAALLAVELKRLAPDGRVIHTQSTAHEFTGKRYQGPGPPPAIFPCQFVSPVSHPPNRQLLAAVDQVLEERLKPDVVRLIMLARVGDGLDDLVTYRLPARGSSHPVKRFGGPTGHDLRNEGGLDLRQAMSAKRQTRLDPPPADPACCHPTRIH
ncbi:MAG: AAA family ATPase [Verrucomicrobia bacterium]|nr:AAA family ATPase [Verrucomicrobiota bacterium]